MPQVYLFNCVLITYLGISNSGTRCPKRTGKRLWSVTGRGLFNLDYLDASLMLNDGIQPHLHAPAKTAWPELIYFPVKSRETITSNITHQVKKKGGEDKALFFWVFISLNRLNFFFFPRHYFLDSEETTSFGYRFIPVLP